MDWLNGFTCKQCGRQLVNRQRSVCSLRCKNQLGYRKRAAQQGRAVFSRIPLEPERAKTCVGCGRWLPKGKTRWCTMSCKQRWYYQRRQNPDYHGGTQPGHLKSGITDKRIRDAAKKYPSILRPWTAEMVNDELMYRLSKKMEKLVAKRNESLRRMSERHAQGLHDQTADPSTVDPVVLLDPTST